MPFFPPGGGPFIVTLVGVTYHADSPTAFGTIQVQKNLIAVGAPIVVVPGLNKVLLPGPITFITTDTISVTTVAGPPTFGNIVVTVWFI